MKAAVLRKWRTIETRDVDVPVLQSGEVLLRVGLAGICGSDVHIFNGDNPIATAPVIQGHEFMGVIADLGDTSAEQFKVGDRAIVQPLVFCGTCPPCQRGIQHVCEKLIVIGVNQNGAFAEYVRVPADTLFAVPDGLPDEAAVLAEPFSIGYHACQRGGLVAGQRVLAIGGGPIGLYAALVARELGASDVVISEPIAGRRALAESFGLAAVDPTQPDAQAELRERSEAAGYDVVIETSGVDPGIAFAVEAAAVHAKIVSLGFPAGNLANYNFTRGIVKELTIVGSRVCPRDEFAETLRLLKTVHGRLGADFDRLIVAPRSLDQVADSIGQVAAGVTSEKILIRPE